MAVNHEELLETIGKMTVLELSEFVEAFKEKFNVTAVAAAPVAGAAPSAAGAVEEAAEEQTEFDVILEGVGDKKIQVIKVVREVTSLGLKDAKDLAETAGAKVMEQTGKESAQDAKSKLEAAGATVELV